MTPMLPLHSSHGPQTNQECHSAEMFHTQYSKMGIMTLITSYWKETWQPPRNDLCYLLPPLQHSKNSYLKQSALVASCVSPAKRAKPSQPLREPLHLDSHPIAPAVPANSNISDGAQSFAEGKAMCESSSTSLPAPNAASLPPQVCSACNQLKPPRQFSVSQLLKYRSQANCIECVAPPNSKNKCAHIAVLITYN